MRDIIKNFFNKITPEKAGAAKKETDHDVRIATCALFLEMAKIDETFTQTEMDKVLTILEEKYGLAPEHASALLEAADEELKGSIDYWHFTNLINKNYSTEEKIDIIQTLWQIVYVDGKMDKYENHLMHTLSNLLRLTHQQLIDAKLSVIRNE